MNKPNGCQNIAGWLLTVGSTLFILLCILMIFHSEDKMNDNRAEYAAANEEYQQALEAYEADSARMKKAYNRLEILIDKAEQQHDTTLAEALRDSLALYAEPEFVPRGAIGFNIGGAFFLFFALCGLIPLIIGILLLVVYHKRKRAYRQYNGL